MWKKIPRFLYMEMVDKERYFYMLQKEIVQ